MSSKKYGANLLKGALAYRVPKDVTPKVIEEFLSALDCPRSLAVWLMWKHNEHDQLAQLKVNPSDYRDMVSCRDAYDATKLLSKYTDLSVSWDICDVAMEKFFAFELLCKQTNARFRNLASDPLYSGPTVWLHNAVIRKIAKVLDEFDTDEFFSLPDWGPGATTLIKRRQASSVNKFQLETGITRDLHSLIPSELLASAYPRWGERILENGCFRFQVGNKVITVPKDATTDRVIAVEPGINLWFQKSIGEMIRKRLLRSGIDLRYQERNQRLAWKGSKFDHLATVDLSSASDSIAVEVVKAVLPPRWLLVMDSCRSHYGVQSGKPVRWEKFSSMGNGFTFELETLIFYAVCVSCCEYLHIKPSDVSVYGDDIILPSACFELFSRMMVFYGFQVNGRKSFIDSPFRESCGSHYYLGSDLKPIYLKDRLMSIHSVYRLANAIRRLASRRNATLGCDARFRKAFELLVQSVPTGLRLRIPEGLGDGGFVSNFDEATPSKGRKAKELSKRGFEGFLVSHLVDVSKTYDDERDGYLLASLWAMPERPEEDKPLRVDCRARLKAVARLVLPESSLERNSVPLSGRVRTRLASSLVSQWSDLGPWV